MLDVQCPRCGNQFKVKAKRPNGSGSSWSEGAPITVNELILASALKELHARAVIPSIRETATWLWLPENRARFQRKGRAWSEGKVRNDMSFLLGHKMVRMIEGKPPRYELLDI